MRNPSDIDLIEHLAGRGGPERRQSVCQALRTSPDLRRRYQGLTVAWELLGEAAAEPEQHDLWPRIAPRLRQQTPSPGAAAIPRRIPWWARAAAAVVLAACAGHLAGRTQLNLNRPASQAAPVADHEVAQELRLGDLASSTALSLADELLGGANEQKEAS